MPKEFLANDFSEIRERIYSLMFVVLQVAAFGKVKQERT